MSEPYIAIQIPMMPADTNKHGTIFGGVLLSNIDLAGAIAAHRELQLRGGNPKASFVTVAINRVEFKKPVMVGDTIHGEIEILSIKPTSKGNRAVVTTMNDVVNQHSEKVISYKAVRMMAGKS